MSYSGGQYRTITCAILDHPLYQALSSEAKLLVYTLKLTLGLSGIDKLYPGGLEHLTGFDSPMLASSEQELMDIGWLERDDVTYWLVEALAHENLVAKKNANHRKSILRHLRGLPSPPLANAFASRYPDVVPELPFPDDPPAEESSADSMESKPDATKSDRRTKSQRAPMPEHVRMAKDCASHLNPQGWNDEEFRRECSIAKAMLGSRIDPRKIVQASEGLAAMREAGDLSVAEPGQPLSLRVLYASNIPTNHYAAGLDYYHGGGSQGAAS